MTGSIAVYALQLGCVGTGLALAWRRPEHRPLAALMALGLAVDVALELALPFAARVALGTCYPWAAWAVASGVLKDEGPGVAMPEPFVTAAFRIRRTSSLKKLALCPELRRVRVYALASRLAIPLAFALFVTAVLASGIRGPALARCYAAAQFVVALGCGWAVWRWKRRGPGTEPALPSLFSRSPGLRARPPGYSNGGGEPGGYASRPLSATTACALVVAFVECAQPPAYLLLPSWTSGRSVYALGFMVVLVVQAVALR